jgi:hypothetical protein
MIQGVLRILVNIKGDSDSNLIILKNTFEMFIHGYSYRSEESEIFRGRVISVKSFALGPSTEQHKKCGR